MFRPLLAILKEVLKKNTKMAIYVIDVQKKELKL
jgi:hypothetical protein